MTRTAVVALAVLLAACGTEANDVDGESLDQQQTALQGCPNSPTAPTSGFVSLRTGVTMHYVEQGSRNGEEVIFLHGFTDSHHSFDLNLPNLPARYHAFALDQRGHGLSSGASSYSLPDFVEDVVAFMDAKGIRHASLVGHSMGSFIAHGVAARDPKRIKQLVLIGSAPTCAGNPVVDELSQWIDTFTDPVDPVDVRDFQASTLFQPVPASYLDTMVEQSLRLPAERWQAVLHGLMLDDHRAQLANIHAKTLVLWGDQDGLFTLADEQALVAAIPRAKLVVFEQTGHGLHAEQPARFEAELERFLH